MQNLNIISITKQSYGLLFENIKIHILLSYCFYIPVVIIGYKSGLSTGALINPETNEIAMEHLPIVSGAILATMFFTILLSIFFFRLYSLGKEQFLQVSLKQVIEIFSKYFLYNILLTLVYMLAGVTLAVLLGIILAVIGANIGDGQSLESLNSIIFIIIIFCFSIIACKLNLTFISIARGEKTINFKNSWYYTTDHIKSMLAIFCLSIIPIFVLNFIIGKIAVAMAGSGLSPLMFQAITAPISVAMMSIACAAGSLIYKEISQNFVNDLQ